MLEASSEVREEARSRRKQYTDDVKAAKVAVEDAINVLEQQTRSFGGHLSKEGTSTIDAMPRDRVQHRDGRVMRFVRLLDAAETPYLTALVTYRGRWLVIPTYKLRSIG